MTLTLCLVGYVLAGWWVWSGCRMARLERIAEARQRGFFTREEVELARCWQTCAVGEQHAAMPDVVVYVPSPRSIGGQKPADETIRRLGNGCRGHFYWAVLYDRLGLAERQLDLIEDRALQLKRGSFASSDEAPA